MPDHTEYETLMRAELGKYGFADVTRAARALSAVDCLRYAACGRSASVRRIARRTSAAVAGEASFSLFGRRSYQALR